MLLFWAAAGVLSAAAAAIVLLRAAQAASQAEPTDPTPVLYRRQLAEIGELAERGLIGEAERKSAEAEAGRRLLAATDHPALAWSSGLASRTPLLAAAAGASVLALALYVGVGAPGMGDQPFAQRLQHWTAADPATLTAPQMAAVLAAMIKKRPNDPEGYRFLALAEGASNNPAGAARALRHAVALAPARADLWEMLGEALILQAGGEVTDDARQAFVETLARDPSNVAARFQVARAKIDAGDKAGGLADWRLLLSQMSPQDPRRDALQHAIAEAEGVSPPQAPEGLSTDQLAAVRGMVAGLAERLKANPDDPQGWVRLVRAYAVLGDTARRDTALTQARARYAAQPAVINDLARAAAAEPMR
jgi:cytochrome c-type biogenesis protein CcmH